MTPAGTPGALASRNGPAPASSRDRILDAGESLMLEVGYDKASIDRICARSGLPVGSFYHHFRSKTGLLSAFMERARQRVFDSLPDTGDTSGTPEERMRRYWAGAAEVIVANIAYFNLEIDLVRLSQGDPALASVMADLRSLAEQGLVMVIEPFARDAGARDPRTLSWRLAALTVTFTRGAVLEAGHDVGRLRRGMDDLYLVIRSAIVEAGRSAAHPPAAAP